MSRRLAMVGLSLAIVATLAGYYAFRRSPAPGVNDRAETGYVDSGVCAGCHKEIAASYRQTAMSRAFYRATPERMSEDFATASSYYHKASNERYTMIRRGDQFFERRHQLDSAGREINVFEQQIHYVM